jgi:ABC-2 type transport system ATP-binding protein
MALTADHVVVIGRGRLIADTSLARLLADSGHGSLEEAFLELTAGAAEFRTAIAEGEDR